MRWALYGLIGALGLFGIAEEATADSDMDYGVLIISRERLETNTSCEMGIYIQDQLVGRVFPEASQSFNLPPGRITVRLRVLPGAAPGCDAGIEAANQTNIDLHAGQISKYRIAIGPSGWYLRPSDLNY